MAVILKFGTPVGRRQALLTSAVPGTVACEIIPFPGVRYERWTDDEKHTVPQKKRAKRKKRAARRV